MTEKFCMNMVENKGFYSLKKITCTIEIGSGKNIRTQSLSFFYISVYMFYYYVSLIR